MAQSSNAVMAKQNGLKRATIPFTVVCAATAPAVAASIDGEFAGNAEIFVASLPSAAQVPSRFGAGGAATSALDPSATPKTLIVIKPVVLVLKVNPRCSVAPIVKGFATPRPPDILFVLLVVVAKLAVLLRLLAAAVLTTIWTMPLFPHPLKMIRIPPP